MVLTVGGISAPVACGLILHFLFNKFEHTHLSLLKPLLLILPLFATYSPQTSLLLAYTGTYITLIISILAYRLSPFHPLARYPGPLLARCTKFWGLYYMTTGKFHLKFMEMHRKYGDVIRVGPNEISIVNIDAIQPVMGAKGMPKGPLFAGRTTPDEELHALICITDTEVHLQRRKVWNKPSLVDVLLRKSKGGNELDLGKWISFFSYDFMGDMAFGAGFELMKNEDKDGLWNLLIDGLRMQAFTQHIPWATFICTRYPERKRLLRNSRISLLFGNHRVERGKKIVGINDLSSYLLNEHPSAESAVRLSPKEYMADTFLAIVAGADSVSTLSEIFQRLRDEIDQYYPLDQGEPADDTSKLANMPFLNAYIPKDTAIYIPPYTLHRDPRYFSPDPESFIPDRWLSNEYKTNQSVYIPFSIGPMNCVGKLLGQLELRLVLATLVQKFDFEFRKGWDVGEWDAHLDDYFLFEKGVLPVVVHGR
ncbi:cytochrome P450 [Cyathus striatus]|nr:cytochrome P450 [Cyathus striatus]